MKKFKLSFRFYFNTGSIMERTHIGEGETIEGAVSSAWQNMAKDNFKRKLIVTTIKIELLKAEKI